MAPDPLAAKLTELATANDEGLLNDDEYRLLRQNLFERYSSGAADIVVSSQPVVLRSPPRRKHIELVDHPPLRSSPSTPSRSKMAGVAHLLRRATGRKPPPPPSPAPNIIKLSLGARIFSKKHEDSSSSDTESSLATRTSSGSRGTTPSSRKPSGSLSPTSPTRMTFDAAPKSPPQRSEFGVAAPPSKYDVVPGGSNDIFDDENLNTSAAIRDAISAVEAECRRLVTAFNDLETSAIIRYRQEDPQRARSGSTSTAALSQRPSISPLPPASASGANPHAKSRSRSNSQRMDQQSIRSNNSLRTTKSTASLFQSSNSPSALPLSQSTPPSGSASSWSTRISTLRRKGSVASLLSQGNSSFLTVGRAATPTPSVGRNRSPSVSDASRSVSHLPLPNSGSGSSASGGGSTMMELLNNPTPEEGGEELAEVRRRRGEMVGRCEARLDYLRVRLKTAELHEKLLRK
ncbi:hypothetical protein MKEN_00346700 [Mycena kentingensis (nom. inval.)]|nr:hypothetical protein MKEN_00346700 [Mycena kentingensis (nom. inval.)]